jgi:hypothetical protein
MRGNQDPFALQRRSAEVRRENRRLREEAERERREASATPLPTPAVQVPPDDESAGSEPDFVLPAWLRFGSRPARAPVQEIRLAHVPVTRDVMRESEQYVAEMTERVKQRDAALPRARGRTKYLYGSDGRGSGPSPGEVMDYRF